MLKNIISCSIVIVILLLQAKIANAQPNNKFGIHLATPDDADIRLADELVNSTGGRWGYVTLVIQENDRDRDKWQSVFEKLRERKLIPIIRIATEPDGNNWKRPDAKDAESWVIFLDSLQWVVKNRYIILFNEPNHATEWGGEVDPSGYAQVAEEFARLLKEANRDFFVMPAGFDASAPSNIPRYQDSSVFMAELVKEVGTEDFPQLFDGWSSHSYPNPGFSGSPYGSGKGSVRTYQWELDYLSSLGVDTSELPVFITETGWNGDVLTRDQVAANFRATYTDIWLPDERVYAVTPFILNYQSEPFLKFSWVSPNIEGVYPEYTMVQSLTKQPGMPDVEQRGGFRYNPPKEIVAYSTYQFQVRLQNNGQAIWDDEEYSLTLKGLEPDQYLLSSLGKIRPGQSETIEVFLKTFDTPDEYTVQFVLSRGEEVVLESDRFTFAVVPLPSLEIQVRTVPKIRTNGEKFELQIFNSDEKLIFRESDISVEKGIGNIDEVENIALGEEYRVVLLKKHYLPRQEYMVFKHEDNTIRFKPMWPLDPTSDGALDERDFLALPKFSLWWPF